MRKPFSFVSRLSLFAGLCLVLAPLAAFAQGAAKPAADPNAKVDINSATQAQLEALPGIGASTAKKIIAGRPYTVVGDLAKAGVSAKTIAGITPHVTVGPAVAPAPAATPATKPAKSSGKSATTASTTPVNLNTATETELEGLPGVGAATAKKIIAARPFASVSDLSKAGLTAKAITKITPLVTVDKGAAPAAAAAPVAAPPATTAASKPATAQPEETLGTPQQPPVKGMVWVNLNTKVYHKEGDRYYGNTKNGKWMTEADAIKAGYRLAKQ